MSDITEFEARFAEAAPTQSVARRQDPGQATQIEQARAIAEVRAMIMIAMENPRNEEAARAKMQRVCRMPALAERAFFRVPRGVKRDEHGRPMKDDKGKNVPEFVNGETIQLARELARCWGNIDYSVREMSRNDQKGQSEMMAYAWDLEENVRPTSVFIVEHKLGQHRITSNQQIYENNAGHAGRRLREMIFNVLPEWFKAEAVDLCHQTLRQIPQGKSMADMIRIAIEEFSKVGVSVEMLQRRFGRSTGEITPEDLATMRVMLRSIRRGEVTVAEEFPPDVIEARAEEAKPIVPPNADSFEAASAGATPAAEQEKPDARKRRGHEGTPIDPDLSLAPT